MLRIIGFLNRKNRHEGCSLRRFGVSGGCSSAGCPTSRSSASRSRAPACRAVGSGRVLWVGLSVLPSRTPPASNKFRRSGLRSQVRDEPPWARRPRASAADAGTVGYDDPRFGRRESAKGERVFPRREGGGVFRETGAVVAAAAVRLVGSAPSRGGRTRSGSWRSCRSPGRSAAHSRKRR